MTARAIQLLLAALIVVGIGGCRGTSSGGDERTAQQVLAQAKKQLDTTPGVELSLRTGGLPEGVVGVLKAEGTGTHPPAFEGTITVVLEGVDVNVPVVAVGGNVYAKLPFTTKFAQVDPADYGAPSPADLMATQGGISSWLTTATGVQKGNQTRQGEQVLTSYSGTLPGKAVVAVIPSADASATFPVTFGIDGSGRLATAALKGPFYGNAGTVDYTVEITRYGVRKTITEP